MSPAARVFDVLIMRPLGCAATLIGVGLFPAAALMAAPGGREAVEQAWESFILVPAQSVYKRPLGEF